MTMANDFKQYTKYRWTPEHTRFVRQARLNLRLHQGVLALAIVGAVGAVVTGNLDTNAQMLLFGMALAAILLLVLYDFRDRARRYQGLADALRRERELYEAEAGVYANGDRAFTRFVRRCEAIIQSNGEGYIPLMINDDENDERLPFSSSTSASSSPFGRSSASSLRNRLSSSSRFGSSSSSERSDSDDDSEEDSSSSRSRFGSGNNPFGSSRSSNPFSSSRPSSGGSPFGSRFGSSSSSGRPNFRSGGIRPEDNEDPALANLGSTNSNTGVRFAAYYPKELAPNAWHPLKAYAYLGYAMEAVVADAENQDTDRLPEILYSRNRNPRYRIPEGAQVTVTPTMPGFQFNPQSVSIGFYRNWHRFDFELRAVDAKLDEATNGYLTFTVNGLVVADVPLSIYVGKGLGTSDDITRRVIRRPYRTVYASFAQEDMHLAERLKQVYDALGMYNLRDMVQLRVEGEWHDDFLKGIDEADIFQLFWSRAAAESETVAQEVAYARSRVNHLASFIRPVYWEQPPAELPEELAGLKAAYLPDLTD